MLSIYIWCKFQYIDDGVETIFIEETYQLWISSSTLLSYNSQCASRHIECGSRRKTLLYVNLNKRLQAPESEKTRLKVILTRERISIWLKKILSRQNSISQYYLFFTTNISQDCTILYNTPIPFVYLFISFSSTC